MMLYLALATLAVLQLRDGNKLQPADSIQSPLNAVPPWPKCPNIHSLTQGIQANHEVAGNQWFQFD